ncbi:hypothetical protein PAN31108_00168 [Pandoraea anhela]|uniref:Uncharacterized protein n=1 Tax=Pandoraea anhela TaxID=2508295 RepID=A0A5E4RFI0_9BURK|nr:hypothetical protein PAN31108_00168 [Pandoraea anhela]
MTNIRHLHSPALGAVLTGQVGAFVKSKKQSLN